MRPVSSACAGVNLLRVLVYALAYLEWMGCGSPVIVFSEISSIGFGHAFQSLL